MLLYFSYLLLLRAGDPKNLLQEPTTLWQRDTNLHQIFRDPPLVRSSHTMISTAHTILFLLAINFFPSRFVSLTYFFRFFFSYYVAIVYFMIDSRTLYQIWKMQVNTYYSITHPLLLYLFFNFLAKKNRKLRPAGKPKKAQAQDGKEAAKTKEKVE